MMGKILWLWAYVLVPSGAFGTFATSASSPTTTHERHHAIPAFVRCGAGACRSGTASSSRTEQPRRQQSRSRQHLPASRRRRTHDGVMVQASVVSGGGDSADGSAPPPAESSAPKKSRTHCPGNVVPKGAEEQDEAVIRYAEAGDWKGALRLLKEMRMSNYIPSVTAYVATIEACRREHLFSIAMGLFGDMNKTCMPKDLFQMYAAPDPNDPTVTQTERVFGLLMMMREDNVSPLEETYRAIMGLCSKEGLWQLSLLLLQHLKNKGLTPRKFVWDEMCTVLFKAGRTEMATMLYETALEDYLHEHKEYDQRTASLDLHDHTSSTALAMVRVALLDMVRKPESRPWHDPQQTFVVITGIGNNSKHGAAIIKPAVLDLLTTMDLDPVVKRRNEGAILISPKSLQNYLSSLPAPKQS